MVLLCLTVFAAGGCRRSEAAAPKAVEVREDGRLELNAVTFNIRYENPGDESDRLWANRVVRAVRFIRRLEPDVMGMQEVTHGQAADLRVSLPDFDFVGVARDDGLRKGEYAPVFYRKDRFSPDLSDTGTFWLSSTPETPGSVTWGNTFPRTVVWIRLVDRATGRGFYVFNTHFDHRNQPSREHAALLIASKIDSRKRKDEPVVLLGDFNAVETNPALAYLAGAKASLNGQSRRWDKGMIDTYRVIHPRGSLPRTLHLWGRPNFGWKVDHIYASRGAVVLEAAVAEDGAPFASDHFPVTAKIVFP